MFEKYEGSTSGERYQNGMIILLEEILRELREINKVKEENVEEAIIEVKDKAKKPTKRVVKKND